MLFGAGDNYLKLSASDVHTKKLKITAVLVANAVLDVRYCLVCLSSPHLCACGLACVFADDPDARAALPRRRPRRPASETGPIGVCRLFLSETMAYWSLSFVQFSAPPTETGPRRPWTFTDTAREVFSAHLQARFAAHPLNLFLDLCPSFGSRFFWCAAVCCLTSVQFCSRV